MTDEEERIRHLEHENLELKIKAQNCLADLKKTVEKQEHAITVLLESNKSLRNECIIFEELYQQNCLVELKS